MKKVNSDRIRNQMISIALLRGCIFGCAAAAIVLVLGVSSNLWYVIHSSITALAFILLAVILIGFVIGGLSGYRKMAYAIRFAEITYGGDFDAEPMTEFAGSDYFYTGGEFLVWYRDLSWRVWHRCDIARIDNVGRKTLPGNQMALVRITNRNKEESVLPYRISPKHNFLRELIDWVNPDALKKEEPKEEVPESKPCPYCGAVNRGNALFCAYCGSELKESEKPADVHEASLDDMGYAPVDEVSHSANTNQVSGTTVPHRTSQPSYARVNVNERNRESTTFWILFAAMVALVVVLMLIIHEAGQPHYW